ncbi:MAG: tetratricopeptide repeat protein [Patescibacteria group bacterium]
MDLNFLNKKTFDEDQVEDLTATLAIQNFSKDDLDLLKYARMLVYILVFLVPLFFLPFTSEILEFNKQFLIFALSAAGLILYLGQVIRTGQLVLKKSLANYGVLVFLGAALLVSLLSSFRYQSIFGGFEAGFYESLVSSASFAILFFLILNVFGVRQGTDHNTAKNDVLKLLNIFGTSLFSALLLGVLVMFKVPVFKLLGMNRDIFSTAGTFNVLGIISAFLMILAFSGVLKNNFFSYVRIPALFLSLFVLFVINWWILWLVAIIGLVFVMASNSLSDWRISNYFWPLVVILLAVVSMLLNFNLAGILSIDLPLEVAPSFSSSFKIAREVLTKNTFFGVGPENFSLAYDLYKPISVNNTVFWNVRFQEATSELFNIIISFGVIGLVAFLFLIWIGLKLSFKNYGLMPLFIVLVAAWVLYPYNMTLGFSFWFLLGVLALLASGKNDELTVNLEKSPKHSLITSVSFVGILVLVIIGFYFLTLRYVANLKFAKALTTQDVDRQTEFLVDAINLSRSEGLYSRSMADLLVSRINQELRSLNNVKTARERQDIISRIQNFSVTAINLSNEITQRHGEEAFNWFSRALVYESLINIVDGSEDWAIRIYDEYSKRSPKDPVPYLKKGSINLTRADFLRQLNQVNLRSQVSLHLKSAEENYQKAIELKSNYVLAIYNLGVVYERQGRVKDAIRQLELTRSANPLDANISLQLGLLYYRDNQKDQAFNEFQKAISIFPDFSNARWYLALLYEERGRIDNALEELRKIEVLNPDNQVLKSKINELEAGRRSIPPQRVTGIRPLEENQNQ